MAAFTTLQSPVEAVKVPAQDPDVIVKFTNTYPGFVENDGPAQELPGVTSLYVGEKDAEAAPLGGFSMNETLTVFKVQLAVTFSVPVTLLHTPVEEFQVPPQPVWE